MTAATVTVDGVDIAYDDEGSGDPLVLVHGHPFDRSMWRPQRELFSRHGWRVIVPDLRGYGASTVVPGRTTLATFARDIAGLLDRLGVGPVVLGGLSMGGQVVMDFYRQFPRRVRGLVLADTSPVAETTRGRRARRDAAERLVREGMLPFADEALPMMVASHTIERRPAVTEHVRAMMRRTPPEGAAAALRGRAERPDYVETLGSVAVPTLVVVGSEDGLTPVSTAEYLHATITTSTLAVIDGAGHLPNLERPGEFNAVLAEFLAGVAPVRGDARVVT